MKTNRRGFFQAVAGLGVTAVVASLPMKKRRPGQITLSNSLKFGYISAEDRDTHRVIVYLNDKDVTRQCFEADDREGYVGVLETDGNGNIECPLRRFWFYGDVRIERKA